MRTTLRIEIESTPESVAVVRATVRDVANGCALPRDLSDNLITAVSEACNNVVIHAYPRDPGQLAISLAVAEDAVDVEVRDWGQGARTLVSSGGGLGMGVRLIRATTDEARFESRPGGGMSVQMVFGRSLRERNSDAPAGVQPQAVARPGSVHPSESSHSRRQFGLSPSGRRVSGGSLEGNM